jgi:hypothetical protein
MRFRKLTDPFDMSFSPGHKLRLACNNPAAKKAYSNVRTSEMSVLGH